ncbi:MAG: tRNA 2-thiocytidine biosynthesis protein TtcA [Oscillospiraceae bacterium]|jgi:tRNA(Ile)-lysidine synthase TilS/MesJ|nr:tRNA 2-thiocytidine biosynthesis protein TtcA [Oscillospiraceae bacterium]
MQPYPIEGGASLREQAERSLFKSHRKRLWTPFLHAIRDYQLIRPNDRIAVCVSGGKDSTLLASLFAALERVTSVPFTVRYLCMDPGYLPEDRALLMNNAEALGIPLHVFDTDVFDIVRSAGPGHCYLCARMRRGHLYKEAQELGCNKIALAHHYNDVVETILMGMLYGAQIQTMMPKLRSKNFPGMELIRPLYLVREPDVIAWRDRHGLTCLKCGCPMNMCAVDPNNRNASKRGETKRLIAELKKTHPAVEQCIFQSVHRVNLNTIIGYVQDGTPRRFTDDYDAASAIEEPFD